MQVRTRLGWKETRRYNGSACNNSGKVSVSYSRWKDRVSSGVSDNHRRECSTVLLWLYGKVLYRLQFINIKYCAGIPDSPGLGEQRICRVGWDMGYPQDEKGCTETPTRCLASKQTELIWLFQFRSLERITPRYLTELTWGIGEPSSVS